MKVEENKRITIIGGGLAGSEAASFLLKRGYTVDLYERRPSYSDNAHETSLFGELVCSNSLKSSALDNACGLLKEEMREMDSISMRAAEKAKVPGGNALTVDRELFAKAITDELKSYPTLIIHEENVLSLPDSLSILASGPLTDGPMLDSLGEAVGKKNLSFFDASAPIVKKDSLDFSKCYYKSRFEQDDAAYINCPFSRDEYFLFVQELLKAEKAPLHSFDTHYFEGCLPLEVMASRGMETLRHGPLKPFGLEREGYPRPYAVVQLRQDNKLGEYYNIVGFQTNLTYPEQKRVFSLIPGLEHAEFLRYGLMHRNSYIDAPSSLNPDLSLKKKDNVFIAGQLSGVEGYVESAAMGIIAAVEASRRIEGKRRIDAPLESVTGRLIDYLLHSTSGYFEPMNANWALFPNARKEGREETILLSLKAIKSYWEEINE